MFYEDSKSKNCWIKAILEIGIGLIFLGLIIYIIGVLFMLDRGLLAIGNVWYMLLKFIDIFPHGNNFSYRGKKYLFILFKEIKATRKRFLLFRFLDDYHGLVYVYSLRICSLNVWAIPLVQVIPNYNIGLCANSTSNRTVPQEVTISPLNS